jgi:hypothetical protein
MMTIKYTESRETVAVKALEAAKQTAVATVKQELARKVSRGKTQ